MIVSKVPNGNNFVENPVKMVTKEKEGNSSQKLDSVLTFIDVLPEMKTIYETMDTECYSLHKDSKLGELTEFFKGIILLNSDKFSQKSLQEKANILYNCHQNIVWDRLSSSEEFLNAFDKIASRFEKQHFPKFELLAGLEESLKGRMNLLHSLPVKVSIASALGVKPSVLELATKKEPDQWLKTPETKAYPLTSINPQVL